MGLGGVEVERCRDSAARDLPGVVVRAEFSVCVGPARRPPGRWRGACGARRRPGAGTGPSSAARSSPAAAAGAVAGADERRERVLPRGPRAGEVLHSGDARWHRGHRCRHSQSRGLARPTLGVLRAGGGEVPQHQLKSTPLRQGWS